MKALIAFEPFHQDKVRIAGMYRLLKQLGGKKAEVETGFVVTRTESELNLAFDISEEERFTEYPRQKMKEQLQKSSVRLNDNALHVVDFPSVSTTAAVDEFLKLAKSRKASILAAFSHSRKGFEKFLVGSFAETLIHRSKLPILIASPQCQFSERTRRIVYAMDFSKDSFAHLKRLFSFCHNLGAELIVFHAADLIYRWSADDKNPDVVKYRKSLDRHLKKVKDLCSRAKVPCQVEVVSEFVATSDLALRLAKEKKADLIAVVAKAGPTLAFLGGSVTRQIVRASDKPVLVLR